MKKLLKLLLIILIIPICSAFTLDETIDNNEQKIFCIDTLSSSDKKYKTQEIETCGYGSVKSYMDYRAITDTASKQYRFIAEHMTVDDETGFLYDEDGFIGAALGSYYGIIGDRFYFTFENGVTIPIVKIESKANIDTDSMNCFNPNDNSVIEFVIDKNIANDHFGYYGNGLVLSGNFGNYPLFKGKVMKIEKVLDEKNEKVIEYHANSQETNINTNIFYYASGY